MPANADLLPNMAHAIRAADLRPVIEEELNLNLCDEVNLHCTSCDHDGPANGKPVRLTFRTSSNVAENVENTS
jgi:hypothetical protein